MTKLEAAEALLMENVGDNRMGAADHRLANALTAIGLIILTKEKL